MKDKIREFLIGLIVLWTIYILVFSPSQVIIQAGIMIIGISVALVVIIQLLSYISSKPQKAQRSLPPQPKQTRPASSSSIILNKIREARKDIEDEEAKERQRIEQLISQNPEDAALHLALARSSRPKGVRALWNTAQRNLAITSEAEYKKAIQFQPNLVDAHLELGLLYSAMKWQIPDRQDASAKAEFELKEAISLKPNSLEAMRALTNLYRRNRKLKEAEEQIKLAVLLDPKDKLTLYTYGIVMLDLGNPDEADLSFRKLFPEFDRRLHKIETEAMVTDFYTGKVEKLGISLKDKVKNRTSRSEVILNFGWLD